MTKQSGIPSFEDTDAKNLSKLKIEQMAKPTVNKNILQIGTVVKVRIKGSPGFAFPFPLPPFFHSPFSMFFSGSGRKNRRRGKQKGGVRRTQITSSPLTFFCQLRQSSLFLLLLLPLLAPTIFGFFFATTRNYCTATVARTDLRGGQKSLFHSLKKSWQSKQAVLYRTYTQLYVKQWWAERYLKTF